MSLTRADFDAAALANHIRSAGYRCRWHPGGDLGVVVFGQRGQSDYHVPLMRRGCIAFSTREGLWITGDVPPVIQTMASAFWPLRLNDDRDESR